LVKPPVIDCNLPTVKYRSTFETQMFNSYHHRIKDLISQFYSAYTYILVIVHCPRVKGKGHPVTGHEGPTGGVEV
jgi:hypothetical protein